MRAADDAANGTVLNKPLDMAKRIDDSRVRTAENHNDALRRVEERGLVVGQVIHVSAFRIREEGAAGILEICDAGNRAGDSESLRHFGRSLRRHYPGIVHKTLSNGGRYSHVAAAAIRVSCVFLAKRLGVGENRHGGCSCKNVCKPSGMVVVAVTQDDRVHSTQIDSECFGVMGQDVRLSCVEENALGPGLDPKGETVFRQQAAPSRRVFNQNREFQRFAHADISPFSVIPGSTVNNCDKFSFSAHGTYCDLGGIDKGVGDW